MEQVLRINKKIETALAEFNIGTLTYDEIGLIVANLTLKLHTAKNNYREPWSID